MTTVSLQANLVNLNEPWVRNQPRATPRENEPMRRKFSTTSSMLTASCGNR